MTTETGADGNSLLFAAELLNQLAIPYALIGGAARNVWAPPRVTEDVDMTALIEPDERALLLEKVREADLPILLDSPDHIRFNSPQGIKICVLIAGTPLQLETVKQAVEVEDGMFVARREHLIVLKCIAHRANKPDLADAQAVLESARIAEQEVDVALIEEWVREWDGLVAGTLAAWEAVYAAFQASGGE